MELDQLDRKLLKAIGANPGAHVRAIYRPFLEEKSESALRARIRYLAYQGIVKIEKERSRVRCYPVPRKMEA